MFRFKQFAVRQEQSPMKVGTDGVLLGAWAAVRPEDRRILDIGTGTGLIALMLAQRTVGAQVVGIDLIDLTEARSNAADSPWGDRIRFEQVAVQAYRPAEPFDLIVSNPPYFIDSLTCPDDGRTTARHAVTLSYEELCAAVMRLLAPDGHFAVVLPMSEAARWTTLCRGRLRIVRRTEVRTTPRRAPKRVLLECVHASAAACAEGGPQEVCCDELVIGTGEHEQYTPEYRALTRDFYLKF